MCIRDRFLWLHENYIRNNDFLSIYLRIFESAEIFTDRQATVTVNEWLYRGRLYYKWLYCFVLRSLFASAFAVITAVRRLAMVFLPYI